MKKYLITTILCLVAASLSPLHADDPTPTPTPTPPAIVLPVQIPVQVTTVQVQETDTVTPEVVLIDLKNREIGVKFEGVEARQVISGPAYDSIVDTFWSDFATAIIASLFPQETQVEE